MHNDADFQARTSTEELHREPLSFVKTVPATVPGAHVAPRPQRPQRRTGRLAPVLLASTLLTGGGIAADVAQAPQAQAAWRASDPTVYVGQPCPKSYEKGILNKKWFVLAYKGDTATSCTYYVSDQYGDLGYKYTFAKKRR
jgi:hypothetical protein